MSLVKISSALISVYSKDGLDKIVRLLHEQGVKIYSTGGTEAFIKSLGCHVIPVENLTGFPSILGGRVKTLHPKIFGGILFRRDEPSDVEACKKYEIPSIDLVIVDLYPFEETVKITQDEATIIEKIDIGGISLIRAAAKNFHNTLVVSQQSQYQKLFHLLKTTQGYTTLEDRKYFAAEAFMISSHYDTKIFEYFNSDLSLPTLKISELNCKPLRYGENPHQKGNFYGDLNQLFDVLNGKELSYNNLVDVDACIRLIDEFSTPKGTSPDLFTFAIIKHTNACGVASAATVEKAYSLALECDPISAFGGVLITNGVVDLATASKMQNLFFEVLIAPDFEPDALEKLQEKKNRILLRRKNVLFPKKQIKTLLNGFIEQDVDTKTETKEDLKVVTIKAPSNDEIDAMLFANKIVKHTKSNTIVLAKNNQLLASGVGQTSRVDALKQAIEKAKSFGLDLKGAVMASDAFFPFPDCVEIAGMAGITAVLQPGGSIKDKDSIAYCDAHGIAMVFTGYRHFLH